MSQTIANGVVVPGTYININNTRAIDPYAVGVFRVCIFGEHFTTDQNEEIAYARVLSEADAFNKYGNSVTYSMLKGVYKNLPIASNTEVYCVSTPIKTQVGAYSNFIKVEVPSNLVAGTMKLVVDGEVVYIRITADMTAEQVTQAIVDGINSKQTIITAEKQAGKSTLQILSRDECPVSYQMAVYGNIVASIESYKGGAILYAQNNDDMDNPTFSSDPEYSMLMVIGKLKIGRVDNIVVLESEDAITEGNIPAGATPPTFNGMTLTWTDDLSSIDMPGEEGWLGTEITPGEQDIPVLYKNGNLWEFKIRVFDGANWSTIYIMYYPQSSSYEGVNPPKSGWMLEIVDQGITLPNAYGYLTEVAYNTYEIQSIDIDDYIAVLPDDVISLFVNPYNGQNEVYALADEIKRRFTPIIQLEGHQVITAKGTVNELLATVSGYNDQHLTVMDAGLDRPTSPYMQLAELSGVLARELSEDPARPMMQLDITGTSPEVPTKRRTFEEQNALIKAGIATMQVDSQGNVETQRITTTYTNTNGFDDNSYRDANTIFTCSYLRQSLIRLIGVTYHNYKLADDGMRITAGQKVTTPSDIKATIVGWYSVMMTRGLVENIEQFKEELIVNRNTSDATRVDSIIPPDLVNQFRIFAGDIQFVL